MIPGSDRYPTRLDYSFPGATIREAMQVRPGDVDSPEKLSFCRNIFLPLTTACRYTCSYCTYFDVPGKASLMSEEEIRTQLRRGAEAGCREALFTFGDKPDKRYKTIHRTLDDWGYENILDYLYDACIWSLEEGLLPHSNPGDLTYDEMRRLKDVNASMGVMLETTADVAAHGGPRRKSPAQRLRTLENAGILKVPFTTGLLIGIGETWMDRARSLLCIKRVHQEFGHIQEVIIQNVVPNERSRFERPDVQTMRRAVAMARAILPESIEVQIPPNLSPARKLIDCGVGDLGGVSPVTDDYINPQYKWPAIRELEKIAEHTGTRLVERGPVYERYYDKKGWVSERIQPLLRECEPLTRSTS